MAYTRDHPRPPGTDLYWLFLKEYGYYDDISGTEMIALMSDARQHIQEASDLLAQHDIQVADAIQEKVHDHRSYGQVLKTALGFTCQEDLVMARLLLGKNP